MNVDFLVLLSRCRSVLERSCRFIPSGETDLHFETARVLEELEKVPQPKPLDVGKLREAVEAAVPYEPSTVGRNVLPKGDQ